MNSLRFPMALAASLLALSCSGVGERDNLWDAEGTAKPKNLCLDHKVKDLRNDSTYSCDTIGNQVWTTVNLNYSPSWYKQQCGQGLRPSSAKGGCDTLGALYTWADAEAFEIDANKAKMKQPAGTVRQGMCPEGWHVPDTTEWFQLMTYVRGQHATLATPTLTCASGAYNCGVSPYGTTPSVDTSGAAKNYGYLGYGQYVWDSQTAFRAQTSAVLAAYWYSEGAFVDASNLLHVWTSSEVSDDSAYAVTISSTDVNVMAMRKSDGMSLRCLQDSLKLLASFTPDVSSSRTGSSSSGVSGSSGATSSSTVSAGISCGAGLLCGTLTDVRDGNSYPWVQYGSMKWMGANMNFGTKIPATTSANNDALVEKYCLYGQDSNCVKYGALYTWSEAMGKGYVCNSMVCSPDTTIVTQGICPANWHMPIASEWDSLGAWIANQSGLTQKTGSTYTYLAQVMRAKLAWASYPSSTDPYFFSALPAGMEYSGSYSGDGIYTYWWTASPSDAYSGYASYILSSQDGFGVTTYNKAYGLAVRCVENRSSSSSVTASSSSSTGVSFGTLADTRDGQTYRTIVIGSQEWMADNLNYSGDNGVGGRYYTKGWCFGVGLTDTTNHADSASCTTYGRIYRWNDVMNISDAYNASTWLSADTVLHQGICPTGWHVPTSASWDSSTSQIRNTYTVAVGLEGKYLKASTLSNPYNWNVDTYNAHDPLGFSALPTGNRNFDGTWQQQDMYAGFWTSSQYTTSGSSAWNRSLYYSYSYLSSSIIQKTMGNSLRCRKN